MLQCGQLKKSYKDKCVVNELDFEVKEGEVFALLGANGAGKTTTIKMILGLVRKDEGEIRIKQNVKIGYSPDTPFFSPFLTGRETLRYYGHLQQIPKKELEEEITTLLKMVGLEDDKTRVKNYSKGMIQRLSFAQALLGNPDFLILDEPTAGLDALGRIEIMDFIGKLKQSGKTILINSHILNDIERVCDRGIIMKKGKQLGVWSKTQEVSGKSLEEIFLELVSEA